MCVIFSIAYLEIERVSSVSRLLADFLTVGKVSVTHFVENVKRGCGNLGNIFCL